MMTALESWLVNVHEIVCGLDLVGNLVLTLELLWSLPLGGVVNRQLLAYLLCYLQLLLLKMYLKVPVLL